MNLDEVDVLRVADGPRQTYSRLCDVGLSQCFRYFWFCKKREKEIDVAPKRMIIRSLNV